MRTTNLFLVKYIPFLPKIIAENTKVTILSPYLTGLTLRVIGTNKNNIDAIYTKFDIRDLCFGASDISVLHKPHKMGVNLYYNNKLHAKPVITKVIATIGSQNITSGSIKNFDISNAIKYIKIAPASFNVLFVAIGNS